MKNYIAQFTEQLQDALNIGKAANLAKQKTEIKNVLILGLGGSGIGGSLIQDRVKESCAVPVLTNKDYNIPAFVNENTLIIVSSYSGNTEETLTALGQALERGAEVAAVTSGGKLEKLSEQHKFNLIKVPGGHPPRAMLAYSLVQLLIYFRHYNLFDVDIEKELSDAISLIKTEKEQIQKEARVCAKSLKNTIPFIYAADGYGALAVRTKQQINENAKMLCHADVVPEMNHNELVGWAGGDEKISVLFLRSKDEHPRNAKRIEINEMIIKKYTDNVHQVWSKGDSRIVRTLYLIHLGDWISIYLSELTGADPVEVKVIDYLKGELSKF